MCYSAIANQFKASVPVAVLSLPKACTMSSVQAEVFRQVAQPLSMSMVVFDRERGFRVAQVAENGAIVFSNEVKFVAITDDIGIVLLPAVVHSQPNPDSSVMDSFEPGHEFKLKGSERQTSNTGYFWQEIESGGFVMTRYQMPKLNDSVMTWLWQFIREFDVLGNRVLFVLSNIQEYLEGSFRESDFGQVVRQGLFNISEDLKNSYRRVLIVGEHIKLDRLFAGQIALHETSLPSSTELRAAYVKAASDLAGAFSLAGKQFSVDLAAEQLTELCRKAAGLSLEEFCDGIRIDAITRQRIDVLSIAAIQRLKINSLRLNGVDVIEPECMKMPGGLDNFKDWAAARRESFWFSVDQEQNEDDLLIESPKGCLLLGIPGTGKSLSSKALGLMWNLPVLKLDLSAMKGSFVGETGKNIRAALALAEAAAPCILFVDEVDKSLAGAAADYQGDSGTSKELIGTFLTWMQERKAPVFTVLSANDCTKLQQAHPEMFRKGRLDAIFWFDLPSSAEIQEILSIYLAPQGASFSESEMMKLAEECQGLVGAEIEALVKDAVYVALADGRRKKGQLQAQDLMQARQQMRPMSEQMRDTIARLRTWGQEFAIPASKKADTAAPATSSRKRSSTKQESGIMV